MIDDYVLGIIGNAALLAVLAASAYIVILTGELTFGQQGFFACGAYVAALATAGYGVSPVLAIPLAMGASAALGLFLALVTVPLKGLTFSLSTLALAEMIRAVLGIWSFDPDAAGPAIGPSGVEGFGPVRYIFESGVGLGRACAIAVATAVVLFILIDRLERTIWGVRVRAVGQDQDLALQLGLRPVPIKIAVITASGAIAGLSGTGFAYFSTFIEPANFGVMLGLHTLAYVLIGGTGHVTGVLLGVVFDLFALEVVRDLSAYRMIIFGGCVALLLRYRPEGILALSTVRRIKTWLKHAARAEGGR
jgi:branched-chain amino acid transport system permease protein